LVRNWLSVCVSGVAGQTFTLLKPVIAGSVLDGNDQCGVPAEWRKGTPRLDGLVMVFVVSNSCERISSSKIGLLSNQIRSANVWRHSIFHWDASEGMQKK
jgi:hypothetical protein